MCLVKLTRKIRNKLFDLIDDSTNLVLTYIHVYIERFASIGRDDELVLYHYCFRKSVNTLWYGWRGVLWTIELIWLKVINLFGYTSLWKYVILRIVLTFCVIGSYNFFITVIFFYWGFMTSRLITNFMHSTSCTSQPDYLKVIVIPWVFSR